MLTAEPVASGLLYEGYSHSDNFHLLSSVISQVSEACSSAWLSVLWRCWLGGRKGIRPVKTKWCGAGVVICLERGADLHTCWCHCHSLSLASVKSSLVLPFSYQLTWVVLDKWPLNGCAYVCYWGRSSNVALSNVVTSVFLTSSHMYRVHRLQSYTFSLHHFTFQPKKWFLVGMVHVAMRKLFAPPSTTMCMGV